MKINIKGTGIELTEALSSYVEKALENIKKFMPEGSDPVVQVEIGKTTNHHKSGDIFKAEINIEIEGELITARNEEEDLYHAINQVRDEVIGEIKKMKDKKRSLIRRGGQKIKNTLKRFF